MIINLNNTVRYDLQIKFELFDGRGDTIGNL